MGRPCLRAGHTGPTACGPYLGPRCSPWASTARPKVPTVPCRPDRLTKGIRAYLAVLVGLATKEEVEVIAYLGSHMADSVALVMRSTHRAGSFRYPIVDDKLRLAKKMTN